MGHELAAATGRRHRARRHDEIAVHPMEDDALGRLGDVPAFVELLGLAVLLKRRAIAAVVVPDVVVTLGEEMMVSTLLVGFIQGYIRAVTLSERVACTTR